MVYVVRFLSDMTPGALLSVLDAAIPAASGLTAVRLWYSGLYRRYPVLFAYMTFGAIDGLVPEVFDARRPAYFWVWICTQPMVWLLNILVVRELCRVVLEKHPGVVTIGRWVMYAGVVLAAFLSFLSLLPHIDSAMPARSRILEYWVAAGRGISFSLAIFLLLMLFAVSRYPVRLSRNVVLNAVLFTYCFLSDSLTAILSTIFDRRMNPWVSVAVSAAEVACLLLWFFRLTPEGEQARFDWIHFAPEYEKRVLSRLDALSSIVTGGG
jgi:uncharacterized membrane protein YozB (DUF420 family)